MVERRREDSERKRVRGREREKERESGERNAVLMGTAIDPTAPALSQISAPTTANSYHLRPHPRSAQPSPRHSSRPMLTLADTASIIIAMIDRRLDHYARHRIRCLLNLIARLLAAMTRPRGSTRYSAITLPGISLCKLLR